MRRVLVVGGAVVWMSSTWVGMPQAAGAQSAPQDSTAASTASHYSEVVAQYCVTCHNQRSQTAGLALDAVDIGQVAEHGEVWEKVVRKLRTVSMPPFSARQPDAATRNGLIAWLEGELDRAAAANPNPGRPLLHRLNRTEYAHAIRDLLDVEVDVTSLLPPDDSAYGFDNVADVLGVSQALLERYLTTAGKISALAVGDVEVSPGSETYLIPHDRSQDKHIEGLPFGTVGGTLVRHTFPVDGEYILQASLYRTNVDQTRGLEDAHELEITLDGERVFIAALGGTAPGNPGGADESAAEAGLSRSNRIDRQLQVRVPVDAGPHEVGVAFIARGRVARVTKLQPFVRSSYDTYDSTGVPHVETLVVVGPFNVTGSGDTPSRRRIFICRPATADEEEPCARDILSTLARRAFRQTVSEEDLQAILAFYRAGRAEGTFDTGIQRALHRILASPKFVFRFERAPAGVAPGENFRISDFELASRLSFFLWSTIPDDELLTIAEQGGLRDPVMLEQQVQRMLRDPRAQTLVENFAGQWLQLRNLRRVVPDGEIFPDFDDNLREAFQRETELLFESVMREDRNVLELLTADYTFVNERLARHYEIPNVYGSHFRRVPVASDARRGLLGHGSILTITSNADRTSPVVRGKWILDNLLGIPPPPPIPNVPPLPERKEGEAVLTMREQMEQHRANPVCAACHKLMDPFGLALENFDAVGAWRARDAGSPVDATTELYDGTRVDGVIELRQALLTRPEVLVGTLTEKLLIYALGRGLEHYDMPVVRGIVRDAARRDYRFSALILGLAQSTPFQMRAEPPQTEPALAAAR